MNSVKYVDEIVRDSFGLGISSLFSAITGWNPSLKFDEHKDAFFSILEDLLRANKIGFVAPGADCYVSPENPHPRLSVEDNEAHWQIAPEEIIAELRSQWPEQARDEDDLDLLTYFYSIPAIIWIGEDGRFVAS